MKNFRLSRKLMMGAAIACSLSVTMSSCEDDDENTDPVEDQSTLYITENTTWAGDMIHNLNKRTIVTNGATLTIGAGAIVKGAAGIEADAKPLVIAAGAKIDARGTATKPIIFTSASDNIEVGQIAGTNLTKDNQGEWAGLIILGNAPVSPKSGNTDRIEGIPASIPEGVYGGSNASDNSGFLQYVSVRHAGVELVPGGGNEINGITLGGVGSGTTIDHVEVIANKDDGIEWFGGTVDVSHALVAYQGDDAFDIDQAYAGTITNVAYLGGSGSDHAFEIDGPEGTLQDKFTLTGGKIKGDRAKGEFADFRSNAKGTVENIFFWNFPKNADVELDAGDDNASLTVSMNYNNGDLLMRNCSFNVLVSDTVSLGDISADKASPALAGFDFDAEFAADGNQTTSVVVDPTGFDKSQFTGWTWADAKNLLSDF